MHDVLKQLNDRNPSDLQTLDERALQRLESCARIGRRKRRLNWLAVERFR